MFHKTIFLLALVVASVQARAAETSSTSSHDTYVLVHGAWGGGWAFREVDRLLTAHGHKVFRPTLTGLGEKVHLASPDINLTTHVTDIVNAIQWDELRDIVLVGHSYGGAVITGVADRVPDRIKSIIYLDAFILNDGESITDAFPVPIPGKIVDGFSIPSWVNSDQPVPRAVPHPVKTMTEKLRLKKQELVIKIPTTYAIFVKPGSTAKAESFYPFYLRAKERGWTLRTLASDHNAQWSHPKELVALLEEAIKNQTPNKAPEPTTTAVTPRAP